MRKNRSDGWSKEEDQNLAKTIIQHIKNGSTQLKAFEEVGTSLNRTAAACGFRWNNNIRKKYENEIEAAKILKKTLKFNSKSLTENEVQDIQYNKIDLSLVISSIKKLKNEYKSTKMKIQQLSHEIVILNKNIASLKTEGQALKLLHNYQNDNDLNSQELEENYQSLRTILHYVDILLLKEDESTQYHSNVDCG